MDKRHQLPIIVGLALATSSPALAAVAVYTDEAAFDAAVSGAAVYTPVQDVSFASAYAFGPVIESATFLDTYTGDYGPGVRSLGAFLSPVVFTSTQNAFGLELAYYIGPQTATYTIDGVSGTILVPDNAATPHSTFVGFTDTGPVKVSFKTDGAEFDTLRVVSGTVSAAPEPSTWAFLLAGVAILGWTLRRDRVRLRPPSSTLRTV